MTLADLQRMSSLVNMAEVSRALGYDRTALANRIKRGSPEITPNEVQCIELVLRRAGLSITKEVD